MQESKKTAIFNMNEYCKRLKSQMLYIYQYEKLLLPTTNCKNWRGITAISPKQNPKSDHIKPGQVLYGRLRREHAGYQSKRSCIDQINALRIIIEQRMEYVANLYLLFVNVAYSYIGSTC
jgi:hypothetical protein